MGCLLKNKTFLKLVVLAAIAIPIGLFVYNTDFHIVRQELAKVGFRFVYIIGITCLAYFIGTLGWWVCLGKERSHISLFRLFIVRQVGETVGLYNPTSIVGGDMLKNELLKPYAIPKEIASESVVVSRVTAVLSQLLLFIVSACWLLVHSGATFPVTLQAALVALILLLASFKLFFFRALRKPQDSHKEGLDGPTNWIKKLKHQLNKLIGQTTVFFQTKKKTFWISYALFALHWIVGSIEFYLLLVFLGFYITPMHGILLDMGVIVVKSLGAFVPGQLGVEELGNKLVLMAVGIQATSVWLAVSILRRTRQLFWIFIGFLFYFFVKKTPALTLFNNGSTVRQS